MPDSLEQQLHRFNNEPISDRKLASQGCLIFFVGFAAAVVLGFAGCAYVVATLPRNLDLGFGSNLKPIPVSQASCPYLRLVRDTAAIAGKASGEAQQETDAITWPRDALLLAQKLTTFDVALSAAAMHTPPSLAEKLEEVRIQVNDGVQRLAGTRTGHEWSTKTFDTITKGYWSLTDASDLTGTACGFIVAPGPDVFLNPNGER